MANLTIDRVAKGWKYRIGGYRLQPGSLRAGNGVMSVVRTIDWDDVDSQPMWEVFDIRGKQLGKFIHVDDALDFAEATYELETI